jgi:hypothetical protein
MAKQSIHPALRTLLGLVAFIVLVAVYGGSLSATDDANIALRNTAACLVIMGISAFVVNLRRSAHRRDTPPKDEAG